MTFFDNRFCAMIALWDVPCRRMAGRFRCLTLRLVLTCPLLHGGILCLRCHLLSNPKVTRILSSTLKMRTNKLLTRLCSELSPMICSLRLWIRKLLDNTCLCGSTLCECLTSRNMSGTACPLLRRRFRLKSIQCGVTFGGRTN